jgi:2-C-methyl-D-erythritol 2,4-cyclodiphosphate synthase
MPSSLLVGHGLDSHRLVAGRRLLLGGVPIEAARGAQAHSDGDALLHALADALLSTAGLGDIGVHFPDDDAFWSGADSAEMLARVLAMLVRSGVGSVVNVAGVVVLDEPKLSPHRDAMTRSVAGLVGLPPERVGITFKTSEGGAPDHVQASVTVLVRLT